MKKHIIAGLLAASAALASSFAFADTVVINQTFDLSLPDASTASFFNINSDNFADTTLRVGDTVQLNFSFLPSQALSIGSTGGTQNFSLGLFQSENAANGTSIFSINNVSFDLLGASGSFPASVSGANQSSGNSSIGASFSGAYLANNSSVAFTGIHASFNVVALQGGQSLYNAAYLSVGADSVAVTSAVPEPETYAMLVAGLGLLAFAQRRKAAKKLG
jgi:hypothetical protein